MTTNCKLKVRVQTKGTRSIVIGSSFESMLVYDLLWA